MNVKIYSHLGEKPAIDRANEQAKAMIEVMSKQLDVMLQLATAYIFIPEGTRLTDVTPEQADKPSGPVLDEKLSGAIHTLIQSAQPVGNSPHYSITVSAFHRLVSAYRGDKA